MREKKQFIYLTTYFVCILYITIFSRSPSLTHTVKAIPFWSFIDWFKGIAVRGSSIGLNFLLFVPLGYLVSSLWKSRWKTILVCLAITTAIESVQFFSYRGFFDIDDIICNLCGGILGGVCCRQYGERIEKRHFSVLLILLGIAGCFFVGRTTQVYEKQFDFDIENVEFLDGEISFNGVCSIYGRESLNYKILLKSGNEIVTADTKIYNKQFSAKGKTAPAKCYEVDVQFDGYEPISTRTFINGNLVEYVHEAPTPEIDGTDLGFLLERGTLKVYEPVFDVFVYQVDRSLYWLIGKDFAAGLIYHIHTDEPEKLPEERQQYGFSNRSFRIGSEKELTKVMNCGKYIVFSDIIPSEYHITAVMVGMNEGSDVLWRQYFRVNRF